MFTAQDPHTIREAFTHARPNSDHTAPSAPRNATFEPGSAAPMRRSPLEVPAALP